MSPRTRLLDLLASLSYERRRVNLASGRESDFFIDCKQTVLTAEGHALAGQLLLEILPRLGPCEAVAGVELGGCPLASAVSLTSYLQADKTGHPPLPALYVRKKAKDHGTRRTVEGTRSLRPGAPVVLLEDVITTGGSSLAAIEFLREAGAQVVGIAALVDRDEGGREAIEAAGFRLESLYTRHDFQPYGG
ncbi:MAG: orotate phosphoribosyltransferase [Myxococcales bacterium]|nr:orotate phosphoribosyltransferase [Polyangiaceae bacterium]MDW8250093.1 orotate phosphoribosyltransferase [Myxococcales bacterium]